MTDTEFSMYAMACRPSVAWDYAGIKWALQTLCKNEGLRFIAKALSNGGIFCLRYNDRIILNTNYHRFREGETV